MRRLLSPADFARLAGDGQHDGHASIATSSAVDPDASGGDRVVRYLFSTDAVGRDLHTVAHDAWQLDNFRANPVFLWAHDDKSPPIGRVIDIHPMRDGLKGAVRYVERDINPFADMVYQLVKGRFLNAVSVSWMPVEWSRSTDPARPGGVDFTKVDMLEISQVPIPAAPEALATARSAGIDTGPMYVWLEQMLDTRGLASVPRDELNALRRAAKMPSETRAAAEWKVGAAKDLPIEDSDAWDGSAAEKSIFEWAGGDDFEPAKARQAFLVYDAAAPEKRGSYKLPIAHAVDGELKVPKGAIKAAASRLSQTDVPDAVKKRAESVLDAYKKKAGIGDESKEERSMLTPKVRKLKFRRGLYECAQLAYVLMNLCGMHDHAVWEEAAEEDGDSKLPEMMAELCQTAGAAFLEMTQEEVAEMLEHVNEQHDDGVPDGERAYVTAGATPRARAWRRGIACTRAGKAISSANVKKLEEAQSNHERAAKHHRALADQHESIGESVGEARAVHERMTSTLAELGYDHSDVKRALEDMHGHLEHLDDAQENARDTHALLGRSMRAAQRCVQSVIESRSPTDPDVEAAKEKEARAARERATAKEEREERLRRARTLRGATDITT